MYVFKKLGGIQICLEILSFIYILGGSVFIKSDDSGTAGGKNEERKEVQVYTVDIQLISK